MLTMQHIARLVLAICICCIHPEVAEAKMYKWVDENGVTRYSNVPPSHEVENLKESAESDLEDGIDEPDELYTREQLLSKNWQLDIETVRDGLKMVRRNGFGPFSLKRLIALYNEGKRFTKELQFPSAQRRRHMMKLTISKNGVFIQYEAEVETKHLNKGGKYRYFNVNADIINRRLVFMGVDRSPGLVADGYVRSSWEQDGFEGYIYSDINEQFEKAVFRCVWRYTTN